MLPPAQHLILFSSFQNNILQAKLSDFILHAIVAEGFSLRSSTFDGSRKFRNLKVAATKSLNLG
jgi:hypothetical protein